MMWGKKTSILGDHSIGDLTKKKQLECFRSSEKVFGVQNVFGKIELDWIFDGSSWRLKHLILI
jgi:hypothetical protein